jgi:hypothetical protein
MQWMTLPRKHYMVLAVSLACLAPSSYSEIITGQARTTAYDWVMQNVLPQQAGLTVGNVVYRYETVKNTEDDMVVYVQNENSAGDGYIFRERDDWSGLPGNKIYKVVGVGDIPIEAWGDGSIQVEGFGTVLDPSVVYSYQYDPCFDPQADPSCPGYKIPYDPALIPTVEFNDPLQDELVLAELAKQAEVDKEEEYERKQRTKKVVTDLEKLLGGLNMRAMSAQASLTEQALFALNYLPRNYSNSLNGGAYEDTVTLVDSKLPDNKKARRVGLAQQLLHEQMVEAQY